MNAGQTLPLAALTLVLGGARSGKSAFGQNLVQNAAKSPVLIATARVADDEMADRIERHKAARGPEWRTIEEDIDLAGALLAAGGAEGRAVKGGAVLVDCLTLWLANVMAASLAPVEKIQALLDALPSLDAAVVFISNEVGLGAISLGHGWALGEIRRRSVQVQGKDVQVGAERIGQLVDRRTPGGKVRHHLGRDLCGVCGHALGRDPVVAGEDQNLDALGSRR